MAALIFLPMMNNHLTLQTTGSAWTAMKPIVCLSLCKKSLSSKGRGRHATQSLGRGSSTCIAKKYSTYHETSIIGNKMYAKRAPQARQAQLARHCYVP